MESYTKKKSDKLGAEQARIAMHDQEVKHGISPYTRKYMEMFVRPRQKEEKTMKVLSADKVKKLPPGTDVFLVRESNGSKGRLWIVKVGKKKMLKGIYSEHEIKDRPGWHYEVET